MKTNKEIIQILQDNGSKLEYAEKTDINSAMDALRDELQTMIDKAINNKSYKVDTYKLEHFILKI